MKEPNELIKLMLQALNMPRTDNIPNGWFRRRDIEDAIGCSEAQAIRYIRTFQRAPGFQTKNFWIDGKKVPFYRVESPSPVSWSEHASDFVSQAPTGEQTTLTKLEERNNSNEHKPHDNKQF